MSGSQRGSERQGTSMDRRTFVKAVGGVAGLAIAQHLAPWARAAEAPGGGAEAMSWSEWTKLDATAMGRLVRKGEVAPKELAAQAARAVDRTNRGTRAVLEVFSDVVADPDAERPNKRGLFYGVPLLLKDAGSKIKGRRQEVGSLFMKGTSSDHDDPLVRNFRAAGFSLIGRTAVPPQGGFAVTESRINGITRNPWDLNYTSGGSSGGAAAAVAAGVVPMATASDGGGSTRSPAGHTALIGLKPTRGRLPMPYGTNEFNAHLACEGVVTRTVRDTAAALDVMWPRRPGETFMPIAEPAGSYVEAIRRPHRRLHVALSTGAWGRMPKVNPEHVAHCQAVGRALEAMGHSVEEIRDDFCDWRTMWTGAMMNWVGACRRWKLISEKTNLALSKRTMEPVVYWLYQAAQRYDLWDLWQMQAANPVYTRQFGRLFDRYDLLVTPTDADAIPTAGRGSGYSPFERAADPDDAVEVVTRMIDSARYMMPANDAGFPAISLPSGLGTNGLPIGVQLHASWDREDRLLQVAAQIELAKPEWFNQIAPLHVGRIG